MRNITIPEAAGRIRNASTLVAILALSLVGAPAAGGSSDLADPSDPSLLPPPPPGAIGWPRRDPGLDALPGFRSPPPGWGEVPFFWWLGDPLTRERLAWQLDRLAEAGGVSGLQVNYAHSDSGGRSYGLTLPSDPPLFSEAWWDLYRWFVGECRKRGMAASLSDYTLCAPGQGFWTDEIIAENPGLRGSVLRCEIRDAADGAEVALEFPGTPVSAVAYRIRDGLVEPGSATDLLPRVSGRSLRWKATGASWKVAAVSAQPVPLSIDPMHPLSGAKVIEKFFGRFEERLPGEGGKGLNFFFSDELDLGISGNLWNDRFAGEFRRRKGYEIAPELPALFLDIGPRTPKIRLDYADVRTVLEEESYFRPIFEWHWRRGMVYGCDHGGRGLDVVEFGDYFRTQRWMTGPGNDSPALSADVVKNKVASSIAHLYLRPRAWLEGYHSSGWGTTTAQLVDATFRNFVLGHNLLSLHGLYYSTHGGWWEWAPPCNHFRLPYWLHMKEFLRMTERLSWLLGQGHHRCDVAILYPVAPVEAGLGGGEAVGAAFGLGNHLYRAGIDFDFMDFESLARSRVEERELRVSGEAYRVLVLPGLRAARDSTIRKALEFFRGGGIVVSFGSLPEASDRAGRDDAALDTMVREIFGVSAREAGTAKAMRVRRRDPRGLGILSWKAEEIEAAISKEFPRDFACAGGPGEPARPWVLHRKVGPRDIYMVYGAPRGSECFFRAKGRVELWDPWTGGTRPILQCAQLPEGTRVRMPLEAAEAQLIAFSPGEPGPAVESADLDEIAAVEEKDGKLSLRGFASSGGRKTATVRAGGRVATLAGEAPAPRAAIPLDGAWEFELQPTLDNRWGDFRWPPFDGKIGAEARRFRYAREESPDPGWQAPGLDDSRWPVVTASFGPRFWKLGPLPEGADPKALEERLAALDSVDPVAPVEFGGKMHAWQPSAYSLRWGAEGDPGHQGYHGLKESVSDEFIALGRLELTATGSRYSREEGGSRYYLWTSVAAGAGGPARILAGGLRPAAAWLCGERRDKVPGPANLRPGSNPLLLRYDRPGRGYLVVDSGGCGEPAEDAPVFSPAAAWIWHADGNAAGEVFFRKAFEAGGAGKRARLRIAGDDGFTAWLNGREVGSGADWTRVQEFDVTREIRGGGNVLAILGRNGGGEAGLIAELVIEGADGSRRAIATDASWRSARKAAAAWRGAGFDDAGWTAAKAISGFEESLWANHPMGPPRLEGPAPEVPSGSLAMRWYGKPGILPFDVRPRAERSAGWFRFTAPPGLRSMAIVARGPVRAWAGGRELPVEERGRREDGEREFEAVVKEPAPGPVPVALRVEEERGFSAGAALPEPVALRCGPGLLEPGDWSRIDGIASYSGGAWYRRTAALPALEAGGRAVLDLGAVAASAEVRVNGRTAAVRMAPPWKVDISGLLHPGENRIEVLVLNTLANHYLTIPTRYRGSPVSGLLGPVRIEMAAPAVLAETAAAR